MTVTRKAFIAGVAGGIASLFLPSLPDAPDTGDEGLLDRLARTPGM